MNKKLFLILVILLLSSAAVAQTKRKASLILFNGKVFVSDENYSLAEAVAIDGERIIAVGTTRNIRNLYEGAKEIDLQGKLVTPGFNDAHVHFLRGALALLNVNLLDLLSLEVAKTKVADKIQTVKAGEWIIGRGWDQTVWNREFPSKADLDSISPDNPVYLVRVDGHVAWVNSQALKLAGIDKNTPNPEGGEIERDKNGEPTGILKETAQNLVNRLIPQPNEAQFAAAMEKALDMARRYGLTSIQDNSGYETTKIYRRFLKADKLTVRVAEWQNFEDSIEQIKQQRTDFAAFKDDANRLKLTALKGYVDGTLGSRTAAMIEPFSDDKKNIGLARRTPEELTRMVLERDKEGWQIALHAIGDRANRMALDSFIAAMEKSAADANAATAKIEPNCCFLFFPRNENRHRIEHAQVIAPSDFRRFAYPYTIDGGNDSEIPKNARHSIILGAGRRFTGDGIIASVQPTHAISDKRWAGERLGEYRVLGAYAWNTFRSYNVHMPLGTDFPVESMNPYITLYAAVTRQDLMGEPSGGWLPQERLSIAEAIRCHTAESAYAEFAEIDKGQIKTGMLADLVVHTKDLLTVKPSDITKTEPLYTIFNGKVIYQKSFMANEK